MIARGSLCIMSTYRAAFMWKPNIDFNTCVFFSFIFKTGVPMNLELTDYEILALSLGITSGHHAQHFYMGSGFTPESSS